MIEILKTLRDTPLPSILVIGGLVFLLIPFIRGTRGTVEIETTNKGVATFLGVVLVMGGVGLYIIPVLLSPPATASPTQSTIDPSIPSTVFTNTPIQQVILPTSSAPRPAESLCPENISQNKVNSWYVGEANADVSVVDQSIKDFDLNRDPSKGNFNIGDTIPRGVLVATNFDERDAEKWRDYHVTPIVHSGSWGLFRSDREYTAPNTGACMTIVP